MVVVVLSGGGGGVSSSGESSKYILDARFALVCRHDGPYACHLIQ